MTPQVLLIIIGLYFSVLLSIAFFTSRKIDSASFYNGDRKSPWYLVAFGMIGASLSGVTFISVPGWVGESQFAYFQVVLGYLLGYLVIATVLMPLYYRLNLTSIYEYLNERYGQSTHLVGASFFILSRTIGAAFRLFLVAGVLQFLIFDELGIPFWLTVMITILLIWIYTFKGGIKTIVWTDSLQTFCMIAAVVFAIYILAKEMNLNSLSAIIHSVSDSDYSQMFFFKDWSKGNHFFKQFLSGAFIALAMTGLDQDMMQKNLTCKNISDAQKNMFWFSIVLVIVNVIFLSLGALLFIYSKQNGIEIPTKTDLLFPSIAKNNLGTGAFIIFFIGLIAAAYSSADSALTSLTTSFCLDILKINPSDSSSHSKNTRLVVHIGFSILLFLLILWANAGDNGTVIKSIFIWAGYTYGPLLGLYSFGLFTKYKVIDRLVPIVCILSPFLTYLLKETLTNANFDIGFLLLPFNGIITFIGLYLISQAKLVYSE